MQLCLAEAKMEDPNDSSLCCYHEKRLHDEVLSLSQEDMLGSGQQISLPASTG